MNCIYSLTGCRSTWYIHVSALLQGVIGSSLSVEMSKIDCDQDKWSLTNLNILLFQLCDITSFPILVCTGSQGKTPWWGTSWRCWEDEGRGICHGTVLITISIYYHMLPFSSGESFAYQDLHLCQNTTDNFKHYLQGRLSTLQVVSVHNI